MKIALGQVNIISGDLKSNIIKVVNFIEQASKANCDLVVFPEMCDTGYDMPVIIKNATDWKHGFVPEIKKAASKGNINVVAGVSKKTKLGVYNSVVAINREGEIIKEYYKTHLITAEPMLEHEYLKAGNELGIIEIEGITFGIMTCYEIRFPEISRTLTLLGAKVLLVPAAWPLVRLPHWCNLNITRAIENQVFVAATSRIGTDSGLQFVGTSMIIGPYGNILASGTQIHEELIQSEINIEMVNIVRNQIKIHQDRRPELYKIN